MNALIAATDKQISSALASAAKRAGAENIALAYDAVAAKRMAGERLFGLIIIYDDAFSGKGVELARAFAARGVGGVILIEAAGRSDEIARRLEDEGIIVLSKPISHAALFQAIKMVHATNHRIARLLEEKRDLLKKLDDVRLINRAKLILMQNMGLTEEQAHHHIEKRAMDERKTRAEIAMDIRKTYEV